MQAINFSFSLYRLNIIDELTLFPSDTRPPIRNDDQIVEVIKKSSNEQFDDKSETSKTIYQWSVREFADYGNISNRGNLVSFIFARSIIEQEGQVVTKNSIVTGVSSSTPPLAETAMVFFDMARHIVAVEYNSTMARSQQWKKSLTSILRKSAVSLNLASSFHLEEIPEKHEIMELFYSFDRLIRLKVQLTLPNPELSRHTKKLYDDLQQGEIREYIQDMKNPSGISTSEKAMPHASASLAKAGYKNGEVVFEGYRNGQYEKVKSSEKAARGKIESLKTFVRGMSANAKAKETQSVLIAITEEIDRLHPRED